MIDPHILISQDVMQCGWDTSSFWLFSDNIPSILINYSHIYTAGIGIFIGLVILALGKKNVLNRTFFLLTLAFATWSILDFYLWSSANTGGIMFVWSILNFFEFILFGTSLYLLYYSIKQTHPPFRYFLTAFLLFLPVILLTPTKYALVTFDYTNCDLEAIEGVVYTYMYTLELIAVALLATFGYAQSQKISDTERKNKTRLLTLGLSLFLFFFLLGNIVGSFTLDWLIAQYGLIGMPVLLAMLGYSMTKYQTFKVRITSTAILILVVMAFLYATLFI
jgi:hypothetical protein